MRLVLLFYSYLNLESTKTSIGSKNIQSLFYSYLNLESTKTLHKVNRSLRSFYSYLNLESTKTHPLPLPLALGFIVT